MKPGGRFAVSDVVIVARCRPRFARACCSGWVALRELSKRRNTAPNSPHAGFEKIEIEPTRIYRIEDAREFLSGQNIDVDAIAPQVDGKFMSAFIRAVKPQRNTTCCEPSCCQ